MKNTRLKETLAALTKEVAMIEQELNDRIRSEAEALVKEYDDGRDAIVTALARGALGAKDKGSFCALTMRHKHKLGETHAMSWGRVYRNSAGVRTRDIKKAARGSDYAISRLTKQVSPAFAELVETTEAKAVELRLANRVLVKFREAQRLMQDAQLPTVTTPE